MEKSQLHLGQRVLFRPNGEEGVVDGISQTVVGLVTAGGYVLAGWDEIEPVV